MTETATKSRGRGRPPIELDAALLLAVSVEEFAENGYLGTRVDDVSERAGVTRSLLFRRFESKDGLFAWTVEREAALLTQHLFEAYTEAERLSIIEALKVGIGAVVTYATARPHGFILLFEPGRHTGSSASPPSETILSLVTARVEEIVRQRLAEQGRPSGVVAGVIASAIVGASEHVARRCVDNKALDPDAVASLLAELLAVGFFGVREQSLAAADGRGAPTGGRRKMKR